MKSQNWTLTRSFGHAFLSTGKSRRNNILRDVHLRLSSPNNASVYTTYCLLHSGMLPQENMHTRNFTFIVLEFHFLSSQDILLPTRNSSVSLVLQLPVPYNTSLLFSAKPQSPVFVFRIRFFSSVNARFSTHYIHNSNTPNNCAISNAQCLVSFRPKRLPRPTAYQIIIISIGPLSLG